tara:strand:- start:8838 stop:8945 length:108 start_codon:yes stop_codon:yes gene_type:complete
MRRRKKKTPTQEEKVKANNVFWKKLFDNKLNNKEE